MTCDKQREWFASYLTNNETNWYSEDEQAQVQHMYTVAELIYQMNKEMLLQKQWTAYHLSCI